MLTEKLYGFAEPISQAYLATHQWLREKVPGYETLNANISNNESLKTVAAQFDANMHHAFKAQMAFDLADSEGIFDRLYIPNAKHVFVDIGCGSGAATAGFLNFVLKHEDIPRPIDIYCIALDPSEYAISIYDNFVSHIKDNVDVEGINFTHQCVEMTLLEGISADVASYLVNYREINHLPSLPHIILTQMNVVKFLKDEHDRQQKKRTTIAGFGTVPATLGGSIELEFGKRISDAYQHLYERVKVDSLSVFTIGTDETKWKKAVKDIGRSIDQVFSTKYTCLDFSGDHSRKNIRYKNPVGGRHFRNGKKEYPTQFYVDIKLINQRDEIWQQVISLENLELAWARTRQYLIKEAACDEIEIRLFETGDNLNKNLHRLQDQLKIYRENVNRVHSRLTYETRKSESSGRPRVLSRLEENLLSVAIIQAVDLPSLEGYEYRIEAGSKTEYLFEYYLDGYKEFKAAIKSHLESLTGTRSKVVETDIESFYTNIEQSRLAKSIVEFTSGSDRIEWLIRNLVEVPIENRFHDAGYGLPQGGAASGFFAKLYLQPLHNPIGLRNQKIKLFRYADDIVLVIPDASNTDEALEALRSRVKRIDPNLKLSDTKTRTYSAQEYLEGLQNYSELDRYEDKVKKILKPLWIMNSQYRSACKDSGNWWEFIEIYNGWLRKIPIYVSPSWLSRKIQEHFLPRKRANAIELYFPDLPNPPTHFGPEWLDQFQNHNDDWMNKREQIQIELAGLLTYSWEIYQKTDEDSRDKKWYLSCIRFALGRLTFFGFHDCLDTIEEILRAPGVLRNENWILEMLARQNHEGSLRDYLDYSEGLDRETGGAYSTAMVLRAMRFLPDHTDKMFEILEHYMSEGSLVEQLMASESLIFLTHKYRVNFQNTYNDIDELHPRLRKNIALLSGNDSFLEHVGDDIMLSTALTLQYNGDTQSIHNYIEPDVIRENYYSANYPLFDETLHSG